MTSIHLMHEGGPLAGRILHHTLMLSDPMEIRYPADGELDAEGKVSCYVYVIHDTEPAPRPLRGKYGVATFVREDRAYPGLLYSV